MDVFVEFLSVNWRFIVEIVLTIAVLFISVFRKKVKITEHAFANFLQFLPELISEAEDYFGAGNGEKKLDYVIQRASKLLAIYYDDEMINYYLPQVKEAIENILATPQKKEVL